MKTFLRLVPARHDAGRFFSPLAPHGAGVQLFPGGLGCAWWRPTPRVDPTLLLDLPPALAELIFATLASGQLSLWVKFPWRTPLRNVLVLVVSLRRDDGSHLTLAWSSRVRTRASAVTVLSACPNLDAVWVEEERAFLDQRHGRFASLQFYTQSLSFLGAGRAVA